MVGSMSEDIVAIFFTALCITIFILGCIVYPIYKSLAGNKTLIDTNFKFTTAITYIGNERIELKIKKWQDYEGEQIQIVTEEGKVYLLSINNTILISE